MTHIHYLDANSCKKSSVLCICWFAYRYRMTNRICICYFVEPMCFQFEYIYYALNLESCKQNNIKRTMPNVVAKLLQSGDCKCQFRSCTNECILHIRINYAYDANCKMQFNSKKPFQFSIETAENLPRMRIMWPKWICNICLLNEIK